MLQFAKVFFGGSDAVGGSALQTAIDSNIAGSTPEWSHRGLIQAAKVGFLFVYKYDMPSFLNNYDYLNMTKLANMSGINPSLMRQYKRGQYISEKQVSKIQTAIHKIGKELLAVRLV